MRTTLLIATLSLVGVRCGDFGHSTKPPAQLSIQLDALVYSHSAQIPVTIINVSDEVLYPATLCANPHFEIDRKSGQGWVRLLWRGPLPGCAEKAFPIQGGERTVAYSTIADTGYYRLVLRYRTNSWGEFADSTYSRQFVIQ